MAYDLKNVPNNAGVYIMKNNSDNIIYIGKAKNLKKRVSSYFNSAHNRKTMELVKNIENIEYIICNSETEAFILENNLIKKHRPKYNILLKDQKTYPYIGITKEKFPKILITRNTKKDLNYFGPFPNTSINQIMKILIKIFKIRDCNINVYKNNKKPCLKYHMNLCDAPCYFKTENVEKKYTESVNKLLDFLNGKHKSIVSKLEKNMQKFSSENNFEKAIEYRDQIKLLNKLLEMQVTETVKNFHEDIITFEYIGKDLILCILSVREGKLINKKVEIFSDLIELDCIDTAICAYYENNIIPREIIIEDVENQKLENLTNWFLTEKNKKIKITIPKKSRKLELLKLSKKNLEDEKRLYYLKKEKIEMGLLKLKEVLKLKKIPNRIECFDISNIQGTNPVASMSVAVNGKLSKKDYRHFKIRCKQSPDDFMMMSEAIERRYSKIDIENLPDAILIDGGKGQISTVVKTLEKIDKLKYVDVLSIAKKQEEIFKELEKKSYIFDRNDEALKILQRLRDEAHRFGITHHRKLRSKRVLESELDSIKGIGEKRKILLLKEFGTVENIFKASFEELKKYIPEKIVRNILAVNHGSNN